MDRVVRADQEVGTNARQTIRRIEHQLGNAVPIVAPQARAVARKRRRVHRDLGMSVLAEQIGTFSADRAIAERGSFGRTGDDADVKRIAH